MEMDEYDTNDIDASLRFVESSRFWVQRVLVPILVFIGIGGNVVTVMVLTRKRMRCTTTIYLTALAVADVIYLIFVLLLSFKHYPNIHAKKFELYWRFFGILHWLCDAASSTSVCLTVSFTIERYIVVCHPMKGKVLCTETRAKNIITIVSILCLLTTISTTFEYQLDFKEECVEFNNGTQTNLCADKLTNLTRDGNSSIELNLPSRNNKTGPNDGTILRHNETKDNQNDCVCDKDISEVAKYENVTDSDCYKQVNCSLLNGTCCKINYEIFVESTPLAKNDTYKTIMYWFSSLTFGILPLILIATFNCYLIHALYKSQTNRKRMTTSQESVIQYQENRITLLLIGIIILFLVCQTPTATYLIYDTFDTSTDEYTANVKKVLGNIFNLLMTLNASCNFVVYCVLSDRYRRTFRTLFCERRLNRNDTLQTAVSRSSRYSHRFNPNANGFQRCKTQYGRTPRNLEAQSLTSIPRAKSLITRPIGKAKSDDLIV